MAEREIEPLNDSSDIDLLRHAGFGWAADEIVRLRERLEEMSLAYINAANPGIDMDEVKRSRG